MLFHMSIGADDPRRVAEVFAELWGGEAMPFPPVTEGCWVAFAGGGSCATLEVYPSDTVLREAEGDADAYGERTGTPIRSASHGAVATPLEPDAVLAIARREGWPAKYRRRGGVFGVIELWVEGHQMMEILTPEMQAEYRAGVNAANWRAMLARRQAAMGAPR